MKTTTDKNLNCKEFIVRNSLLTDLFENVHIRTCYNVFQAILLGFFIDSTLHDYIKNNELGLGLPLIKKAFGRIDRMVLVWSCNLLLTCATYLSFKTWASRRRIWNGKFWDRFWISLLVLYYSFSFQLTTTAINRFELAIVAKTVVTMEQVRLVMKVHSFVRSNAPKIVNNGPVPNFSQFFYFLFAPTLLYKGSYPRSEKINWKFALFKFLEFVQVLFFYSLVTSRFLLPPLQDFGIRKYKMGEIISIVFGNIAPSAIFLLLLFFEVLHVCQNFFAEITRFGDRMFYTDWWTSTSYSTYFRKWNVIVQDWLFLYIYTDFYRHIFANSTLAKLLVVFISAAVHEWIVYCSLGFFFPLLFFKFFVVGTILQFFSPPKTAFFNVFFLYTLMFGSSILVTFYTVEYYARKNTGPCYGFLPRFLSYLSV